MLAGAAEDEQLLDDRRQPVDLAQGATPAASRSSVDVAKCSISSSCRRRPVSGVRSWWEESATNSRWLSIIRPTRPVISLKLRASVRCSVVPSTVARAVQIAGGDLVGGVGEPADRPGDPLRDQGAGDRPEREDGEPEQDDARPPSGGRRR